MEFDSKPPAASLQVMKNEVDELLKASGVSLDWRMASENHGNESFSGLVVLKFRGTCRADSQRAGMDFGTLGETHALGETKVAHGRVLPYTEVKCDEIREALSYLQPGSGQKERQKALGIALGRVVAHELYHILARTRQHAARGLAKASQSLEDLISTHDLGFREEDSRAIEEGVRTLSAGSLQ
jgi:hypothetical protein